MEEGKVIRDKLELEHEVQRIFAGHKFGCSRRMRNRFVFVGDDGEERSVLRIAKLLPLFRLST